MAGHISGKTSMAGADGLWVVLMGSAVGAVHGAAWGNGARHHAM